MKKASIILLIIFIGASACSNKEKTNKYIISTTSKDLTILQLGNVTKYDTILAVDSLAAYDSLIKKITAKRITEWRLGKSSVEKLVDSNLTDVNGNRLLYSIPNEHKDSVNKKYDRLTEYMKNGTKQ